MAAPARVTMREVGARDGIQSLGAFLATGDKIALVDALSASGLKRIEATSFVNPRAVPQMADAAQVMAGIARSPGVSYEALVPNERGARNALAVGVDAVLVVVAASETFNRKNVRMTVDESLRQVRAIGAGVAGTPVRYLAALATSFGCPYEGEVPPEQILRLVKELGEAGCEEVFLADTTGMANPRQVEELVGRVLERWPSETLGLHFHNTRGMGLANVLAGLRAGVRLFDASVGGLGGCPFAPSATGNISTEDTVHMLTEMGLETGIDLDVLLEAGRLAQSLLGRDLPGQVLKAGPRWQLHAA